MRSGKACGVFSLVYFHDTDTICIDTYFQYCIFMKVANALIHDDESVCRDSDRKYEVVSMEMYCPATGMYNLEWRVFSPVLSFSLVESDPRRCQ